MKKAATASSGMKTAMWKRYRDELGTEPASVWVPVAVSSEFPADGRDRTLLQMSKHPVVVSGRRNRMTICSMMVQNS